MEHFVAEILVISYKMHIVTYFLKVNKRVAECKINVSRKKIHWFLLDEPTVC